MSIDPLRLIFLLVCLGQVSLAEAEPPEVDQEGYLTFYLDNDLFGGEDRDYTNGARLSWISGNRDIEEFGLVRRFLRKLSGDADSFRAFQALTGFEDPELIRYNFGLSLTQLMFTPDDPYPYTQPPGQRRYAGWLALGVSLHVKDDRILNSVELSVGTTGEHAFAEPTQDFVHSAQGIPKFNGWDNQIPNEITVDLSFVQKRRFDLAKFGYKAIRIDGLGEWGGRLGSFQTSAYAGGFFRLGYNLPPDFSDPRLSSTAYSHRYFNTPIGYNSPWSVYAIFGGNARLVAFDATLDGPLFSEFDTGIERRPLVGEVFFGGGIRYKAVEFSYVHTWRTEEYETQGGISNFGSLSARVRF